MLGAQATLSCGVRHSAKRNPINKSLSWQLASRNTMSELTNMRAAHYGARVVEPRLEL